LNVVHPLTRNFAARLLRFLSWVPGLARGWVAKYSLAAAIAVLSQPWIAKLELSFAFWFQDSIEARASEYRPGLIRIDWPRSPARLFFFARRCLVQAGSAAETNRFFKRFAGTDLKL
jgi:hypothetical protein